MIFHVHQLQYILCQLLDTCSAFICFPHKKDQVEWSAEARYVREQLGSRVWKSWDVKIYGKIVIYLDI